ncbi:aromatic ring-hydroxylating dioxygenase subunit alpha [Comamonas sp. JC664]|uniref:aromatic ring-hydroxylating oxygenase subunit alpha n=1 Tax=Comamonas sp. JC664 TaxID=2801917 RepID=UPI00174E8D0B|nr:aromatic ring-hydroxylating dioxygenase subunit alpha [Comamonas sp. JC664]MBL0697928.1 aromatic ring-hydroxylating dioxygenase subunit alpha [Comamonas sp. JC664]GHG70428.1 (2Fe-2S)-binding protein [Comamonas sp. KCTC 72670]
MDRDVRPYHEAFAPFWHPVAFSSELRERPLPARLLETDLVIWRTEAGVAATQRYCAHRGADLCGGKPVADGLQCAFHGWTYGRDGRCVRVPSQPAAPIPDKARLASYRCIERYGLVWVCLASEPAAPLPEWPELEDGSQAVVPLPLLDWDVSAGRMLEIVLDVAHLSWVHDGTFGNPAQTEVPDYAVEPLSGGLRAQIRYPALSPSIDGVPPRVDRTSLTYEVTFPFTARLHFKPTLFYTHAVYAVASPVSEVKMRCFYFASYHPKIRNFADMFVKSELAILEQDRRVAEAQSPKAHPLDFAGEVHVKADRLPIEYRRAVAALRRGQPLAGPVME